MATNKYPFVKNLGGAEKPLQFPGLVQAGSTQAIKMGELCVYNETASNWVPADAAGDHVYSLAIAAEEQKAADSARYMNFFALRPDDVWEFALSAAASAALGQAVEVSTSQALTLDVDGNGVGVVVGFDNYPQTGTTIRSISNVQVSFLPEFSYWMKNVLQKNTKKVIAATAAYTLTLEDCGAIVTNKGASGSVTITAPSGVVPIGYSFKLAVMADQAFVFDPKPDTASVYIKGAAQAAGKYVSMTDIGDFAEFVWDGTDWLAINSISGADGDITVEG